MSSLSAQACLTWRDEGAERHRVRSRRRRRWYRRPQRRHYLDIAAQGRPTSNAQEETVEQLADISIPGGNDTGKKRVAGLGPLTGLVPGVGVSALLGLLRSRRNQGPLKSALFATVGDLVGTNGLMTFFTMLDVSGLRVAPHLGSGDPSAALWDNRTGDFGLTLEAG